MRSVGPAYFAPDSCDSNEPFRAHATEVRAAMHAKRTLRIEHNSTTRSTPEDDPMPERATAHSVPFDRQQRKARQGPPRRKSRLSPGCMDTKLSKQPAHVTGFRPQAWILGENAQPVCHSLGPSITHASDRRDTGDPTAGPFFLNNGFHVEGTFGACSMGRYHLARRRSPIPWRSASTSSSCSRR